MATSMFSRRHYEAVAEVMRGIPHAAITPDYVWCTILDALIDLFEADNPRFDRAKFQEECER